MDEHLNKAQLTNRNYNLSQTEVGHTLKTLKGSNISRSRIGIGKLIGGKLYFHKSYADEVLDKEALWMYERHVDECPFDFNVMRYTYETGDLSLVECPGFDTEREPVVGRFFNIKYDDESTKVTKSYPQIFHHKWLWVKNSYKGFDVAESWEWSKEWLSVLTETADGSSLGAWERQLERFGLE